MSLDAKYCSRCSGLVEVRSVEGRPREVCTSCGMVFYQNPLPVAASVVLNKQREVLLIRRKNEPYKGQWCLPIGFAETGETIGQAARRELQEETGVQGHILTLLDADSFASDFYGDLLIVTFEMEKVGGMERAGDDALEVAYYPMDRLPPLAFTSNEKAIQFCAAGHEQEWAIEDSFKSLQADDGGATLSDSLVALVQERAEEVTRRWMDDVRTNPTTQSYGRADPDRVLEPVANSLSQFSRWLQGGRQADAEIAEFYRELGRERRRQGFAERELLSALTLLKKHIWYCAGSQGMWEKPIDLYRVVELNRRIALFFDKALYHAACGFEGA